MQIHQSYLINFDYIEECSYESVKMKNGDTIPISQPYRKSVRTQLAERVWRDRE
ncbi:MAG: LytTR family transcriptional regulator DNA-binding domain-containing protein [Blautia wexlerae]